MSEAILVFGGSGSPKLTKKIADYLGVPVSRSELIRFSEGAILPRIGENVRGRRVYLVQSTAYPANDNFMELLFWIDAFKRASAEKITVVMPYFCYAKGDKKDEPRVPIRARVCADCIGVTGADRIVTMDLHAAQIQGFFDMPVDDLYAMPVLCEAIKAKKLKDLVVVSPDSGFAKKARKYAAYLGDCSFAIGDKVRRDHSEEAEVMDIIGDVKGKTCLVVDDFTISGGTLISVAEGLKKLGAKEVYAALSHGVFSEGSMEKIQNSELTKLLVTDTVETQPTELCDKIEVVSVAPLFAEAIRRIHNRESISVLFPDEA
jgi:ribose-phosphate pyrophosphokinase